MPAVLMARSNWSCDCQKAKRSVTHSDTICTLATIPLEYQLEIHESESVTINDQAAVLFVVFLHVIGRKY